MFIEVNIKDCLRISALRVSSSSSSLAEIYFVGISSIKLISNVAFARVVKGILYSIVILLN